MRAIATAAVLMLGLASLARAGHPSPADARLLRERCELIAKAFDSGNADVMVEMTHPSLYKLMGGKEKMQEVTKAAVAQLHAMGLVVLESKLGDPGEVYLAGDELVCFFPRTTVVKLGDKKVRSTSFFICVRKAAGGPWLFLEGSPLIENPEMLQTLLPALPAKVTLPENRVEFIE